MTDLTERARSDQRNNNSTSIVIGLRRLDNYDERNGGSVISRVPMDVELRHQRDEYSSLIEPDLALISFHIFTVESTALDFASRSSRAVVK